jgi:hypothetical protein
VGEGELEGIGLGKQAPAVGASDDEAALLESAEGLSEAGVVDAELLAQGAPGEGSCGFAEEGSHGLGEGERCIVVTVDGEPERFGFSAGEADEKGVGSGGGAVLDGES